MGTPTNIPHGKLSIAPDPKAPLLAVFGGITVHNQPSGVYMWNYMSGLQSKDHIFVAATNDVNGTQAYQAVTSALNAQSLSPPKIILYLFSGGYRPGIDLLTGNGSDRFDSIFLVDIWMGLGTKNPSPFVPDFYKHFVNTNAAKVTYVYTRFGANNTDARDFLKNKLGPQKAIQVDPQAGEEPMDTHMRTNAVAVGMLP